MLGYPGGVGLHTQLQSYCSVYVKSDMKLVCINLSLVQCTSMNRWPRHFISYFENYINMHKITILCVK